MKSDVYVLFNPHTPVAASVLSLLYWRKDVSIMLVATAWGESYDGMLKKYRDHYPGCGYGICHPGRVEELKVFFDQDEFYDRKLKGIGLFADITPFDGEKTLRWLETTRPELRLKPVSFVTSSKVSKLVHDALPKYSHHVSNSSADAFRVATEVVSHFDGKK